MENDQNGEKLKDIIKNKFDKIKNKDYDKMKTDGNDYYFEKQKNKNGKEVKIYERFDARIFYLYSENEDDPDQNQKFPEFGEWEFLCGYDHFKIFDEERKKGNNSILGPENSGFQACAFKKGNDVMVAYRGTDDNADWIKTNTKIGLNSYAEQLICSAWFFDKVKDLAGNTAEIHVTGHSLGGALAQFAFIYSVCKCETKTWNGLGIGEKDKDYYLYSMPNVDYNLLRSLMIENGFLGSDDQLQAKCENANLERLADKLIVYKASEKTFGDNERIDSGKKQFMSEMKFKLKTLI